MLISFTVSNFGSIREPLTIKLAEPGPKSSSELFFHEHGLNFSKAILLIGANASGKTNILRALGFVTWFIVHSFQGLKEADWLPFLQHIFGINSSLLSEFQIEFIFQQHHFRYSLHCTPKSVTFEELAIKINNRFRYLFKRTKEKVLTKKTDIPSIVFEYPEKIIKRENASIISMAFHFSQKFSTDLCAWIETMRSYSLKSGVPSLTQEEINKYYFYNSFIKEKMNALIKEFDLGIDEIIIKHLKNPITQKEDFIVFCSHKIQKETFEFPLNLESDGTRGLYNLLLFVLFALETGSSLYVDELENSLHPLMVEKILSLFLNKTTNKKNAQIIFSSHCLQPMNMLVKEQIYLIEKDESLNTKAYALADVEGARNDQNFAKKYLAGTYGGIPYLD